MLFFRRECCSSVIPFSLSMEHWLCHESGKPVRRCRVDRTYVKPQQLNIFSNWFTSTLISKTLGTQRHASAAQTPILLSTNYLPSVLSRSSWTSNETSTICRRQINAVKRDSNSDPPGYGCRDVQFFLYINIHYKPCSARAQLEKNTSTV